MDREKSVPVWHKITLSIEEAAELSGIGQKKLREMAQRPECEFALRAGKTTRIKRKRLEEFLEDVRVIR